jgi:uncharacterized surface protein with fasciclin (FAS1) repeats
MRTASVSSRSSDIETTVKERIVKMKVSRGSVVFAVCALIGSALVGGPAKADHTKDIVDTAVKAGSFKILVTAVKAAGLVDTLKGDGPFTVFAPTDAAFKKLEKAKPGILETLLKPENKEKLTAILTYHVVPGKVLAADVLNLKNGTKVKTVNGKSVTVGNKHGVHVDNAKVVKTDIECTNGVIHVIDTVLLPK